MFNMFPLFESLYGFSPYTTQIVHLNKLLPIKFMPSPALITQMKRAYYYGALIYSTTMDELDKVWAECQKYADEFVYMQFHEEYYKLTKFRIENGIKLHIPHVSDNKSVFLSKLP